MRQTRPRWSKKKGGMRIVACSRVARTINGMDKLNRDAGTWETTFKPMVPQFGWRCVGLQLLFLPINKYNKKDDVTCWLGSHMSASWSHSGSNGGRENVVVHRRFTRHYGSNVQRPPPVGCVALLDLFTGPNEPRRLSPPRACVRSLPWKTRRRAVRGSSWPLIY
jgi:hypothetical protein